MMAEVSVTFAKLEYILFSLGCMGSQYVLAVHKSQAAKFTNLIYTVTIHEFFYLDEFNIYTREAGAGKMDVSVEGPSKAKLEVVDRGHGYTTVAYTVDRDG